MSTTEAKVVLGLSLGNFEPNAKRAEKSLADVGAAGQASVAQIRNATRQLPAQFTDIATSLAGGQNPFLVLLQQGGQIRDSFGGIRAALGGVIASINPVVAVGAAVAAVGTAAAIGWRESLRLRDTLVLTGNAAGVTGDNMENLAARVADASQQTIGGARDIAAALIATGRTSAQVIDSQAQVVARIADLSGKAGKEIANSFAGQLDAPAKFAAKLNESYNFLNVAQFKRIQQLQAEGKATEAAAETNRLLLQQLGEQNQTIGTLERAWNGLGKAASGAWNSILGLGRPETIDERLAAAQRRVVQLRGAVENGPVGASNITDALSSKASLQEQLRLYTGIVDKLALERKLTAEVAAERSRQATTNRATIAELSKASGGGSARQSDILQDLVDANRRAGLALVEDERARGQAIIELDREQSMRRVKQAELTGQALIAATAQVNAAAAIANAALNKRIEGSARQASKDPLGEFISERVLSDAAERDSRRLAQQSDILQDLVDANQRASVQLINDERARGEAIIELDRSIALRRIRQAGLTGQALADATREIDAGLTLSKLNLDQQLQRPSSRAGEQLSDSIAAGILDGFRQGSNFSDIFLSELKAQFAKTVLAPIIRPTVDAGNEFIGSILRSLGGFLGTSRSPLIGATGFGDYNSTAVLSGARANGGPVAPGGAYLVGERGPEILRMGRQGGTVVPNSAIGGVTLQASQVFHIDARTDQAQVAQLVAAGVAQGNRALLENLQARGVMR